MESFVSHLATLVAVYDLGPQSSIPVPHYDGPTDLRTDAILKSLSTMAHRMWAAEEALEKHNLNLDSPKKITIPGLPGGKATSDPSAVDELELLKAEVQDVTRVCNAVSRGDLSQMVTLPDNVQLKDVINTMVVRLRGVTNEVTRVTTAVARGDLTQKVEIEMEGDMLVLKGTVNSMVDQLSAFSSEVTRVVHALEVGTQGMLGGQPKLEIQGTWGDLAKNVNKMAASVTDLVRSIAEVTKAVAIGDLGKQMNVDVQGEMLDLKVTVNFMVNRLNTLVCEVSRILLEVGVEGILGGEAEVPDIQGMWKVLVDNTNLMSMNLADQVRSINEVTKAVAGGDFTKKVEVDMRGEMLALKKTVESLSATSQFS